MVEKIMATHGQKIRLVRNGLAWEFRAFFQPVTGKGEGYVLREAGPLGEQGGGRFICIGPAQPELLPEDGITVGGKDYLVRSSQVIWHQDEPLYCRAVCVEKGCEDQWGTNG